MNRRASRTMAVVSGLAIVAAAVVACGDGYYDDGDADGWYGGGYGPVITETHIVGPGRTQYRTKTRTVTATPRSTKPTTRTTRPTTRKSR